MACFESWLLVRLALPSCFWTSEQIEAPNSVISDIHSKIIQHWISIHNLSILHILYAGTRCAFPFCTSKAGRITLVSHIL